MTVEELIKLLQELGPEALKKRVFISGDGTLDNIRPISMSCKNKTTIAYVLTDR